MAVTRGSAVVEIRMGPMYWEDGPPREPGWYWLEVSREPWREPHGPSVAICWLGWGDNGDLWAQDYPPLGTHHFPASVVARHCGPLPQPLPALPHGPQPDAECWHPFKVMCEACLQTPDGVELSPGTIPCQRRRDV